MHIHDYTKDKMLATIEQVHIKDTGKIFMRAVDYYHS